MISVAQHSNQNVRRARRRPAGWLLVEVASGASGRLVSGRLVDTSGGGMGLVLNEGLPEGQLVRVTRGDTSVAAGASSDASSASWEGLEARVAHASPLPDGHWRIGLTFAPVAPSTGQLWCTRLVLTTVFLMAAWPVLEGGAILMLPGLLGAVVLMLAAGAEWQYRSETRAYRAAHARWQAPQVALQPQLQTLAA